MAIDWILKRRDLGKYVRIAVEFINLIGMNSVVEQDEIRFFCNPSDLKSEITALESVCSYGDLRLGRYILDFKNISRNIKEKQVRIIELNLIKPEIIRGGYLLRKTLNSGKCERITISISESERGAIIS